MLPRSSVIRKINDLVKRARLVKVHAHIVAHLRAQMPAMFGGDTKKEELLNTLPEVFKQVTITQFGFQLGFCKLIFNCKDHELDVDNS